MVNLVAFLVFLAAFLGADSGLGASFGREQEIWGFELGGLSGLFGSFSKCG